MGWLRQALCNVCIESLFLKGEFVQVESGREEGMRERVVRGSSFGEV